MIAEEGVGRQASESELVDDSMAMFPEHSRAAACRNSQQL